MPKKIELKKGEITSIADYLKTLTPEGRRQAKILQAVFRDAVGTKPRLWGGSMIGYGEYDYTRTNGDYGTYFATGFSIRKSGPTLYIMPGYTDYSDLMKKLGPHKLGKSCLYLKSLEGIDLKVISRLIKAGVKDLKKTHPVRI
jgi:hypothetical protein